MLVSLQHRLVILATPKCASTALHAELEPDMDVVVRRDPGAKHTNFRKYERHLRRYLASFTGEPLEVVCLFREPVAWLRSWWLYRARDDLRGSPNSSLGWSFARFCEAYLADQPGPARLGRQSRFVARADGAIGVDRIFPYENVGGFVRWLERRLERRIALHPVNVSPAPHEAEALDPDLVARLRGEMAADFAIHAAVRAAGDQGWQAEGHVFRDGALVAPP